MQDFELVSADAPNRSVNPPAAKAGTGFPRAARLLKHSDFERVYKQGRRHFSSHMTVFYLRTQAGAAPESNKAGAPKALRARGDGVRIGFTVSKALGGSVERNRMRRRTREAVRHSLRMLEGMSGTVDVVINPKKSLLLAEFSQISLEIERAFRVIRQNYDSAVRNAKQGAR